MKYVFKITYVDAGPRLDPEVDESHIALTAIIHAEFDDSVSFDDARQKVAFDFEEQPFRILTIEGTIVAE